MSENVGNVSFYDSTGNYENSFQKPFSEATAQLIDQEVRELIEQAHKSSKTILENNRDKLDTLVKLLLEKEVVYKDEIKYLLGKRITTQEHILV